MQCMRAHTRMQELSEPFSELHTGVKRHSRPGPCSATVLPSLCILAVHFALRSLKLRAGNSSLSVVIEPLAGGRSASRPDVPVAGAGVPRFALL